MAPYRTYPAHGEEYDREADLEFQADAEGGDHIDPPVDDPASSGGFPSPALPSFAAGRRLELAW